MSKYELIRPERASILDRIKRSIWLGPYNTKDKKLAEMFSNAENSTGLSVSEWTALNYSAVWSAVSMISGDVASLPLVLYKRDGRKKERYSSHPMYRLLHDSPNPEMSSVTFRRTVTAHALTWGNGYAEIELDNAGRPRYIWPITPDRVEVKRDDSGRLFYRVHNENSPDVNLPPARMFHLPGLGFDGTQGYSVIGKARESIGLGVAAERFGGTFFGNGSTFGGVFEHPTKFSDLARKNFRESINAQHKGVDRAHKFLVVEEGMKYVKTGIPPNDAQFLETREFQITEIARWFNIPPHKIADLKRATFSNIEQQNIEYFQTTLVHWLETWEQELMLKLISPLERNQQFIEHVTDGILRGDSAGRAALQTAEFNIAGITPNEVRELANRNPIEGGDRAFVNLAQIPLDFVDEYWRAQIESLKAKAEPPESAPSGGGDGERMAPLIAKVEELTAKVAEAEGRMRTAETLAEDRAQAREEAERLKDDARAELAQALEHLDGARTALAAEQAERARELAQHEAERDGLNGSLAASTSALAAMQELAEARDAEIATLNEQRDAILAEKAKADELAEFTHAAYRTEKEQHDATLAAKKATEQERDAAVEKASVAETQTREATQARDEARDALYAEQAAHARTQQERDEQVAAREQAQAELTQTRENHAQRVNGLLVAHRALIVDVMQRMVAREIDRAKRHQTTPQKFRAWIDSFYQTHADAVSEALLPAVRVHLSILSSQCDPHDMARQLAEDHVAESEKQLRDLLYVEDFAPMLERTLAQWETSRPESVADRLLTKGLADVR